MDLGAPNAAPQQASPKLPGLRQLGGALRMSVADCRSIAADMGYLSRLQKGPLIRSGLQAGHPVAAGHPSVTQEVRVPPAAVPELREKLSLLLGQQSVINLRAFRCGGAAVAPDCANAVCGLDAYRLHARHPRCHVH
jgi:hypothetical protein